MGTSQIACLLILCLGGQRNVSTERDSAQAALTARLP
jgi:hypothetical protein